MMKTRKLSKAQYDVEKQRFVTRLAIVMKRKKMTSADVARVSMDNLLQKRTPEIASALTEANVAQYVTGRNLPRPEKLLALASALGVDQDELIPAELRGRIYIEFPNYSPGRYSVRLLDGPGLKFARLSVTATLPIKEARVLRDELCETLDRVTKRDPTLRLLAAARERAHRRRQHAKRKAAAPDPAGTDAG